MMNKSYALQRPRSAPVPTTKRQRRKIQNIVNKKNEKNIFSYSCFDCSMPINIDSHNDTEIECDNCSSRIIRKNNTNKDRVVEAI